MAKAPRHATNRWRDQASCRRGQHRYGRASEASGGIVRRTCVACGALSIDLTGVEPTRIDGFQNDRGGPKR